MTTTSTEGFQVTDQEKDRITPEFAKFDSERLEAVLRRTKEVREELTRFSEEAMRELEEMERRRAELNRIHEERQKRREQELVKWLCASVGISVE